MIGNDIVDLPQAAKDSNWKRRGFLDKLFDAEEQRLILNGNLDAELMVWLLWSMKESAYKINNRITNLRSFAPIKLVCSNLLISEKAATGLISIAGETYLSATEFTADYVHTVAAKDPLKLENIRIEISDYYEGYHSRLPQSVSHHGRYLALAYS